MSMQLLICCLLSVLYTCISARDSCVIRLQVQIHQASGTGVLSMDPSSHTAPQTVMG